MASWRRRDEDRPPPAKPQAVKLLSRREHSAQELQRKLKARGIDADAARDAVTSLAQAGLQSDARYADQLTRTRIAQGYGPRRIRAELEQAGLARDAATQALLDADCDWRELASRQRQRKFGALPDNRADRIRQQRFLYGRGFEADQVDAVLKGDPEDA